MSKKLLTFRVYLIRSKGEYLGQVKAKGPADAIELAKTQLAIPENMWERISVELTQAIIGSS
jgi:hypothetical protein